jgi:mRNA interferase HicA
MKRKEFIQQLLREVCKHHRHGTRHDIYINLANGRKQPVPRHTEIENELAKHIRKQLGVE